MNYLLYLFILFTSVACAHVYPVKIGDTPVKIVKYPGKGKTLVHLHENETTALEAAQLYVDSEGGTLVTLQHGGQRNIRFTLNQVQYEFDPNRIFTDTGIRKTLNEYGPYSPAAHAQVRHFAQAILAQIPKGPVIAVHNNQSYSMQDYFTNHPLAKEVRSLFYKDNTSYRNFYFVTQEQDYSRLKSKKFNIALQAKHAQDDGSLSYYLAHEQYINIESAYGALQEQLKMIYNA